MVRQKSRDKEIAILEATKELVAKESIQFASTAKIAKLANVAQGTIFVYFPTKENLFNELFIYISEKMLQSIQRQISTYDATKDLFKTVWESYIEWGVNNPDDYFAHSKLTVSSIITNESREKVNALFPNSRIAFAFHRNPAFEGHFDYAETIFTSLIDKTILFINQDPDNADYYKKTGYQLIESFARY